MARANPLNWGAKPILSYLFTGPAREKLDLCRSHQLSLRPMKYKILIASLAFFLGTAGHSGLSAQPIPLGNIIGGVMQAAAVEAARQAWAELPEVERFCLNMGLRRNGTDMNRLIQQGIGPGDQRLQALYTTCIQITARELAADVECTLSGPGGRPYVSRCRQTYMRSDGRGNNVEIGLEEAISDTFTGRRVEVGTIERSDAANRWREQLAANGDRSRVITPSFSCDKARKPSEIAICNSYELTLYDNQYSDLWVRAKPLDPKGEMARQLAQRNRARDACASNQACIRDATEKGIESLGNFLRSKGMTIVTLADEAAERRQKEAEEKARQEEAAKLRAEQARAEAEAAREAARKREELARRREADAAEFAAFRRNIVASYKAGKKPGELTFVPPQKQSLTEEEVQLAESPCGRPIRTADEQFAAFEKMRESKNDLVQRACRAELGFFEIGANRREEGLALIWSAVSRAENATGRLLFGWSLLQTEWIKDGETSKGRACAIAAEAQSAYLDSPVRRRGDRSVVIAGAPYTAMILLSCDSDMPVDVVVEQQKRICGVKAPEGPLDAFSEQARATCWIAAAGHADFRKRFAVRLAKETTENFEEQRLQKAVTSSSSERRAFAETYDSCKADISAYASPSPGDIGAVIGRIAASCASFLKK